MARPRRPRCRREWRRCSCTNWHLSHVRRGRLRLPKAVVSVRHVSAPVTLLRGSIFWHSCGSSAHQLTVPHDHPRHVARTNTNTSAATTSQISACCGSGGGRGASLMVVPGASWLRWSNLKCRNEAQGPQGAEGACDRCCGYLPPCCARAARRRLMRSSTSLCP
jgi:hypothetical protein